MKALIVAFVALASLGLAGCDIDFSFTKKMPNSAIEEMH